MDVVPFGETVTANKWYRGDTRPPQVALDKLIAFFKRINRPVYLGTAALEVGYSLRPTEAMFDVLEEAGNIRPMTVAEKVNEGLDERGAVYVLVKEQKG